MCPGLLGRLPRMLRAHPRDWVSLGEYTPVKMSVYVCKQLLFTDECDEKQIAVLIKVEGKVNIMLLRKLQ